MRKGAGICLFIVVLLGFAGWAFERGSKSAEADVAKAARRPAMQFYSRLPLSFETNEGQVNSQVKFLARGRGFTLFLTQDSALLELQKAAPAPPRLKTPPADLGRESLPAEALGLISPRTPFVSTPGSRRSLQEDGRTSTSRPASTTVSLKLLGANRNAKAAGADRLSGYTSYFIGNNPRQWHTRIPNYRRIRYHRIYPGVDLVYYGRQGELENDFVVAAGSDPGRIRLGVDGAKGLEVDRAGDLVMKVGSGEVYLREPMAYQGKGAKRRRVAVHYVVSGKDEVGFALGRYDRGEELVIDPVLTYSTYLGGTGGDIGYGIAVDAAGNAYVTGTTASLDFPTTSAGQSTIAGGNDAFVAKFNPTGSALVYSVYLGGGDYDVATGIALDSSGAAYVVGYTYSIGFPTTSGAFQTSNAGGSDAFLTKLDPSGSSLVYSTYLGGTQAEYGHAVAVDASGDAFITGSTQSLDFPTLNPLQVGFNGASDGFVSEFSPDGTALLYSTYFGGTGGDEPYAIALDGSGNPYIAGYTTSSDFPTQSAFESTLSGTSDAFVAEIDPGTSSLVFSTYLGGTGTDTAYGLALDSTGSIYLAGTSSSPDFPVTNGTFQAANHGQGDAFIAKLAPGGTGLVYSTLLGGSGPDQANAIALDSSGEAFVTGSTQSSDFPLNDAMQRVLGIAGAGNCSITTCADAFVAKLGPSGSLIYSTFLGGSGQDSGQAIAVDASGAAYATGSTASANFPVVAGASQSAFSGSPSNPNVFVAKVSPQDASAVALSPQTLNFGNQTLNVASDPQTVTLTNVGSAPLNITQIQANGDFSQTNSCGTVVPAGGGTCTIQVTFTPTQTNPETDQISIADDAAASPQTITVTGTGVTAGGVLTLSASSLIFSPQTVGNTSPPQSVQLINTGIRPVTVTGISSGGDFAETDNCGNFTAGPSVLNVGQACTITVSFTPTQSGSRSGGVTVNDDATNSPQSIFLKGTGSPVFSLSANARSTVLLVGKSKTTFTISASAPSTFNDTISLSCTLASCTFYPSANILPGQSATMTVSGLTQNTLDANGFAVPKNFTVSGKSGKQTAAIALSIFYQDFSMTQTPPTPPLATVTAGQSATYTVTVTPSNGFSGIVLLGCPSPPYQTTCVFSPPGLSLNGTPLTSKLTVTTTAPSASLPRGGPPPGSPPRFHAWWVFLAALVMLFGIAGIYSWRTRRSVRFRARGAVAALVIAILLSAFVAACGGSGSSNPGTLSNTYQILVVGTLGSNGSWKKPTSVNLSVAPQ